MSDLVKQKQMLEIDFKADTHTHTLSSVLDGVTLSEWRALNVVLHGNTWEDSFQQQHAILHKMF